MVTTVIMIVLITMTVIMMRFQLAGSGWARYTQGVSAVDVHYVCSICALRVQHMCITCALHVHYVCIACALHVHYVCIACASADRQGSHQR